MVKNLIAKIVLLGDGGVGKTSLVRRFVEDRYRDEYISTIGSKTSKKNLLYEGFFEGEDVRLKLMIVDIYGQKTFSKLHAANYIGSKGALLVFDETRLDTFDSLPGWKNDLYDVVGDVPFLVLGNKHDLIEDYHRESQKDFHDYIISRQPNVVEFYKDNPQFGDIPSFSMVPEDKLSEFASKNKTDFYLTSAKSGENVEEAFHNLGKKIIEHILKEEK